MPKYPFLHSLQPVTFLHSNWQLCATSANLISDPHHFDNTLNWQLIPNLACAAASLRDLEQWTINDTLTRFDALDWWYRLEFDLPRHHANDLALLGFDGLATLAEIWLNDKLLLTSSNMFHCHQLLINNQFRASKNQLVMVFRSLDHKLKQRYPRPRWRAPMMEHQQLRWLRTTILGRTPGWSPPCAVVGPWRPVWLQHRPLLALSTLHLQTALNNSVGVVNINSQFTDFTSSLTITHVELQLSHLQQQLNIPLIAIDTDKFATQYHINHVERWWPHTHGTPALYTAVLCVTCAQYEQPIEFNLGRIGFRSIAVNREHGNFGVIINNETIFCRGASWMPLDPVTLSATPKAYKYALMQIKAAGMNMLRISGTSCYETEQFYSLCDELGIMLWQEFMFAGMDYPDTPDFIQSVTVEAQQQLAQWQLHPSITIICGNAEVEQQAAMWGAARTLWSPALFYDTLAQLSQHGCPSAFYWPSAGHDGAFPHQCDTGTAFYYGFGAYLRPLEDARLSNLRFATESLAIANIPENRTLKLLPSPTQTIPKIHHPVWKARSPRDLGGAGWDFDDVRDYYVAQLFKVDPLQLRYIDHDRYVYLSKITSGDMMESAFNEWRSPLSKCQGALIWFLRDLWPGAGWGIIDSEGHPKSCYYYLKRALQPISVSLSNEGCNGYYVHIINEHSHLIHMVVDVYIYQAGHIVIASGSRLFTLQARQQLTESLNLWFDSFLDLSFSYRFGPASVDSIYVCLKSTGGELLAETFAFPLGLTSLPIADLGLQSQLRLLDNGNAQLNISCKRLALAIHIDVDGFVADDNYFHLIPQHNKIITLHRTHNKTQNVYGRLTAINTSDSIYLSASVL